jgi:hypothetical protein
MQTIISKIIFLILFLGLWGRTDGRHRFQIAFHFLGRVRDGGRRGTNRPGKTPTRRWKKLGRRLWRWGQLLHPFKLCSVKQIEQLGCYSWVWNNSDHLSHRRKQNIIPFTFDVFSSFLHDTQVNSQSAIFYNDWFAEGHSNEGSDAELSNNRNDSNESEGCSTERRCLLDNAWGETTVQQLPGTWIWSCVVCRVPNHPFMRYCASCWKVSWTNAAAAAAAAAAVFWI